MNRLTLLAVVCGLAVFGAVFSAAATLGTITTQQLGANVTAVSSCDTDGVSVTYTATYNAAGDYRVTALAVSGINTACNTGSIRVQLNNSGTAVGSEVTGTVASGALASTPLTTPANISNVNNVAVVIVR